MAGIDGRMNAMTGASSGIGRAAALLLAGRGATVVNRDDVRIATRSPFCARFDVRPS
jgi:NAD(P)-dependent dehydrogenase (short-subunit alcohol dehydrogenase family)